MACGSVAEVEPDGGGGGDDPDADRVPETDSSGEDGDFAMAVEPGDISADIGTSVTLTVSVDRDGSVDDIDLDAEDLPAGVSVAFDPNPIPAGADSSEATVTLGAGTEAGTSTFAITGAAGAIERSASVDLEAKTINVAGTVLGEREGITVVLVGKSATTSDSSGDFTFTDVTPPYDLYTVAEGFNETTVATYYQGLTRPDPVVKAASTILIALPPGPTATINGNKSGTGDLVAPLVIAWGDTSGQTTSVDDGGGYSLTARWPSGTTQSGTLYGLQWTTGDSGAPDGFVGYAEASATVTSDGTHNVPLTFSSVSTAELTGEISSPQGFPAPELTLTQRLGSNRHVLWDAQTQTVDATIPVIGAGTTSLHATAEFGNAKVSYLHPDLETDTDVSHQLPTPPVQLAPADASTGVNHDTTFEFSAPESAVQSITFTASGVAYEVITTATEVAIPEVPEVPLPSDSSGTWRVRTYGPLSAADDAATEEGLRNVPKFGSGEPRFHAESPIRNYTTAP